MCAASQQHGAACNLIGQRHTLNKALKARSLYKNLNCGTRASYSAPYWPSNQWAEVGAICFETKLKGPLRERCQNLHVTLSRNPKPEFQGVRIPPQFELSNSTASVWKIADIATPQYKVLEISLRRDFDGAPRTWLVTRLRTNGITVIVHCLDKAL